VYSGNSEEYLNILSCPNNILGIEYLKALKKYESSIKPICIPRFESEHNSYSFSSNIASSTAIRNFVKNKNFDTIKNLIPIDTYNILMNNLKNGYIVPDLSIFEKEIIYVLRKLSIDEIANLPDVSEGLEFNIKNAANSCNTLYELISLIKSKRYTQTRIQRILLYALLGVTKNDMRIAKNTVPYVRVLGFNSNGKNIISEISKKNTNLKIITSVKKFVDNNTNRNMENLLNKDILSTNIYTIAFSNISEGNLDFKNRIIKSD